jgi:hypothetical protein
VGHVVLLGHNYREAPRDQQYLVGNAVFLSFGDAGGGVRVLTYDGYAGVGPDRTSDFVDEAITMTADRISRTWLRTPLGDPVDLPAQIGQHDVLLIYEQSRATDEELQRLGSTWAESLWNFVGVGGVIVVVDGGQGNSGTWQLLEAAGLLRVAQVRTVTGEEVTVVDRSAALARGLPTEYRAGRDSVAYVTPDSGTVAAVDSAAVALHLTFVPALD